MKYLLDVNVLLAGIWTNHPQNEAAANWLQGKSIVLCPLAELGFIRISTGTMTNIQVGMDDARSFLTDFASERKAERVPDDLD